jgi:hypothetical protein
MATVNVTATEFADLAMIWLFDQVMNPDQVKNERLKEFIKENKNKMKSSLMAYYFDTPYDTRNDYRRIEGIFERSTQNFQQIKIYPDKNIKDKKKKKEGILKTAAKKVIKKMLAKEELTLEDMQILKEIENDYTNEGEG